MASNEELADTSRRLECELKTLRGENVNLNKKLGIRQFLYPVNRNPDTDMETGADETAQSTQSTKKAKKPGPFFVKWVKSIANFSKWLSTAEITPFERKALANNELKVTLNNADD